jgi:hypothetical protein
MVNIIQPCKIHKKIMSLVQSSISYFQILINNNAQKFSKFEDKIITVIQQLRYVRLIRTASFKMNFCKLLIHSTDV